MVQKYAMDSTSEVEEEEEIDVEAYNERMVEIEEKIKKWKLSKEYGRLGHPMREKLEDRMLASGNKASPTCIFLV